MGCTSVPIVRRYWFSSRIEEQDRPWPQFLAKCRWSSTGYENGSVNDWPFVGFALCSEHELFGHWFMTINPSFQQTAFDDRWTQTLRIFQLQFFIFHFVLALQHCRLQCQKRRVPSGAKITHHFDEHRTREYLPVVLLYAHLLSAIAFDRNSITFFLDFDRPAMPKIAHTKGECCMLDRKLVNIRNVMLFSSGKYIKSSSYDESDCSAHLKRMEVAGVIEKPSNNLLRNDPAVILHTPCKFMYDRLHCYG